MPGKDMADTMGRRLLKRLFRADRPRVVAVIGVTREDVEAGVEHAKTSRTQLPVRAWCCENADPVPGCDRFTPSATALRVRADLSEVWPALTIVAWTGARRAALLKLLPLTVPPFRVVVCNEARGFFPAKPGPLAAHACRRMRDGALSRARRMADWSEGAAQWLHSLAYRGGQRIRDVAMLLVSLAFRGAERGRDVAMLLLSLLVRGAERGRDLLHVACGGMVALCGFLARCTPPFSRFISRRAGMGCPPDALPVPASGFGFSSVVVPGRGWPRRRIVEAIRASRAEFIVFRRTGSQGDPMALADVAHETGAFAVAFQSAFTGWRRHVVNKHPFRQLQAGETARVFAPWSPMIAIRRDLLLRYGVPRAATYGAALTILYWKAASEGLKCLAVGTGDTVSPEPAMELEDVEFAARIALSGSLRWLGPAFQERARGNVACSPGHARGFRGYPRVLVVSPYLPFPLSHGGAVRIYNLCREMSAEIDFVLACFREANETVRYDELHEVFRQVHVVDVDERHQDPTVPAQAAEYRNSAMAALIRRLRVELEIDIVQLEYTQMAEYRAQAGDLPVILVEHDITFTLHRQLAETSGKAEALRQFELWRDFERRALASSSAVWTMSGHDRDIAIEHGAPPETTVVVPNGVDLRRFRPERRQTSGRTILFVGSFRHLPNLLAFEALAGSVMPAVWRVCPDARLHAIAGPHYEQSAWAAGKGGLLLTQDRRVVIEGFVEDVRPAYRECDLVVIPLPVSAGTNIKLMEAMACGRAVVSTPVGCQGLDLRDGIDLAIRALNDGFAEAVTALLLDENARTKIGARARHTAEAQFGWDGIARKGLAYYQELGQLTYSLSAR